jgi:hypothetical protein
VHTGTAVRGDVARLGATLAARGQSLASAVGDAAGDGELPLALPLPLDRTYHSVFVCPVARGQVDAGPGGTNAAMALPCGHVVSWDALRGLASARGRLRCPVCPTAVTLAEARALVLA